MSGRTILVTGGAGYIGSHVCAALAERGHRPVAYDSLVTGNRWAVQWGPLVEGDIRDAAALDAALAAHRPAAVVHCAALSEIGEAHRRVHDYFDVNVAGTLSLLRAMQRAGVEELVFSSSASVYGESDGRPLAEDRTPRPTNPYGATKLQGEELIRSLSRWSALRGVALRYFNAAGAHPEAVIGEAHEPETHLVPRILRAALSDGPVSVDVYGSDYDTPDGTCVRDFVHVADLGRAHVAALDHLAAGGEGATLNIGLGAGFSVREVIAAAERVTGRRIDVVARPRRPGDPAVLVADAGRAAGLLGFEPGFRDIEAIIETAWRWHRHYHAAPVRSAS